MALIKCPKCGVEVSDKTANCPKCGASLEDAGTNHVDVKSSESPENNSNGLGHLCLIILAVVVVGLILAKIVGSCNSSQTKSKNTVEEETFEIKKLTVKKNDLVVDGRTIAQIIGEPSVYKTIVWTNHVLNADSVKLVASELFSDYEEGLIRFTLSKSEYISEEEEYASMSNGVYLDHSDTFIDPNKPIEIVGTWRCARSRDIYIFKSNGRGLFAASGSDDELCQQRFRWKKSGRIINLKFDDGGKTTLTIDKNKIKEYSEMFETTFEFKKVKK